MSSFSVAPSELRGAASLVRGSVEEFADNARRKSWLDPDKLGEEELSSALAEFHNQSDRAVDILIKDADDMVERLNCTAAVYEKVDSDSAHLFIDQHDRQ